MIKKTITLIVGMFGSLIAFSQEHAKEISRDLPSFSRITASPHINLVLREGQDESIKLVYDNIDPEKINIDVKGKTLRIYLDEARFTNREVRINKFEKRDYYSGATITAYITYRKVERLEIRGEQEVTCQSPITSDKFFLKAYGRNEISLVSLKTGYLKTRLYGENMLKISGGKAEYQKYKLYGENEIDTEDLNSYHAQATIFGESRLRLTTQDEFVIHAFGESRVSLTGNAIVNKGLVFGRADIRRSN
jgi:ribosomal protein L31